MPSIVTIMTNYNPYQEAVTALVGGAGLYIINQLTLKSTSTVSKIDRIRETLFGIYTRFLELTKKNTLTQYSWVFLKNIPASLAASKAISLASYLLLKMLEEAHWGKDICIYANGMKYLSFLLILSLLIDKDLNPPKKRPNKREEGATSFLDPSFYFRSLKNKHYVWKDYSQTNLGQKSSLTPLNPVGSKIVFK